MKRQYCSFFLLILFCFAFKLAFSQDQQKIDSLVQALESAKDDTNKVNILNSLGRIYFYHDPNKTLQYGSQALALSEELDFKKGVAGSLHRMGAAYYDKGLYENALEVLLRLASMEEELMGKGLMAINLHNIANIYKRKGKFGKAMDLYLKSLQMLKENGEDHPNDPLNIRRIAGVLNGIGLNYSALGNYKEAINYLEQGLKIREELDDSIGIVYSLNSIGAVKSRHERPDEAEPDLLRSVEISEEMGFERGIAHAKQALGTVYFQQGKYNKAIGHNKTGLAAAKRIDEILVIKDAYKNLAEIYVALNQHKDAYEYYRLFSLFNDSLNAQHLEDVEAQYEKAQKDKEIELLNRDQELREIEIAKRNVELKQRTTQRNALVIGFGLMIVLAFALFKLYHQKKKTEEERVHRQIEKHLNQIALLRSMIENEVTDNRSRVTLPINQDELNNYLIDPLTKRELEVMYLLTDGKSNKEIADALFISPSTVKTHTLKIYDKLNVRNRTEAVVKAGKLDLLN